MICPKRNLPDRQRLGRKHHGADLPINYFCERK